MSVYRSEILINLWKACLRNFEFLKFFFDHSWRFVIKIKAWRTSW